MGAFFKSVFYFKCNTCSWFFFFNSTYRREENNMKNNITSFSSYSSQIVNFNTFLFSIHFCCIFQYDFIEHLPFWNSPVCDKLHSMLGHREPPHSFNCQVDVPYTIYVSIALPREIWVIFPLSPLCLSLSFSLSFTHTHRAMLQ